MDPALPTFDVPELPRKALGARAVQEWIAENVRRLKESGRMGMLRNYAWRQPSPVRFALSRNEGEACAPEDSRSSQARTT